jgi:hypothetical protein
MIEFSAKNHIVFHEKAIKSQLFLMFLDTAWGTLYHVWELNHETVLAGTTELQYLSSICCDMKAEGRNNKGRKERLC